MAWCDFVVKYDPDKDDQETIAKKILLSLWVRQLKANKPCNIFVGGDSGEGKSLTVLKLMLVMAELQNIEYDKEVVKATNVFTPLEYPTKIDRLLHEKKNKKIKKANFICVHESRTLVNSKNWQSFTAQAVSNVQNMGRKIKPLAFFIISQFIRDITRDVRYSLTHYCTVRRPRNGKAQLRIYKMWKDDRDLENPKLKKRPIAGYLVNKKTGKYEGFRPSYIEITLPPKELVDLFDELDYESKSFIIKKQMRELVKKMEEELGVNDTAKIDNMVEYYNKNLDALTTIGKRYRGKWMLTKEAREMHELYDYEAEEFERKIRKTLIKQGIIEDTDDGE